MRLDCHVHIVGTGSSGSGAELRLRTIRDRFLARCMLKELDLPSTALQEDFDQIYVDRLHRFVRDSSLDGAVILAQDKVYDRDGKELPNFSSFYVPNDFVLQISRSHPELIPAVSIHPGRPDAIEELERCAEGGAMVLKLLPNCHNVDCSEARYRRFWEAMARLRIPFLAHTGGELTLPVVNRKLADPALLRTPLEEGVTVIAAHAGSRSAWIDTDYCDTLEEMIDEFPRLYFDNSALCSPNRSHALRRLLEPHMHARVIHGSDFPVPTSPFWPLLRRLVTVHEWRSIRQETNPIQRDYLTKRAIGFSPETFERLATLLPKRKG